MSLNDAILIYGKPIVMFAAFLILFVRCICLEKQIERMTKERNEKAKKP